MKSLFLTIGIIFSMLQSCNAQDNKVGIISNDEFIITMNIEKIKIEGENHLAKQNIKTELTSFEILKDFVEGTNQVYYMLLAKNNDESVKLATTLELKDDAFFYTGKAALFSSSCSCTGCQRGCSPRHHRDDGIIEWYCSSCTVGTGCKKTETRN